MFEAFIVEGFPDGADPAVHHVAWADQISARFSLHNGLLAKQFNRLVVEDHAVLADDPVMTIAGVGIQGDVGHDRHLRDDFLDLADRPRNQAIGVEALGPVFGLQPLRHLGEENDATHTQVVSALHFAGKGCQAPTASTRHGTDRLHLSAFMHKEGIDEVCSREAVLTHHGA